MTAAPIRTHKAHMRSGLSRNREVLYQGRRLQVELRVVRGFVG
jgi:hypothetical protein